MTNGLARSEVLRALAAAIVAVERSHPVRVAIDGVDAAGKTTLADELAIVLERLGRPVVRASVDHFLHPVSIRRRRGVLSPEGYYLDSFDYAALEALLLQPLGPSGTLTFRRAIYNVRLEQSIEAPLETADAHAILLLDGVFLHREELRGCFDFTIFVRAGFDVTVPRAEMRDLASMGSREAVRQRYDARYVPGQQLYLSSVQPERLASIVVDNNDYERPCIVEAHG